jgi:hypothetical protein
MFRLTIKILADRNLDHFRWANILRKGAGGTGGASTWTSDEAQGIQLAFVKPIEADDRASSAAGLQSLVDREGCLADLEARTTDQLSPAVSSAKISTRGRRQRRIFPSKLPALEFVLHRTNHSMCIQSILPATRIVRNARLSG